MIRSNAFAVAHDRRELSTVGVMFRLLFAFLLASLLVACAATAETQEQCTVQWPPGPCAETPAKLPARG